MYTANIQGCVTRAVNEVEIRSMVYYRVTHRPNPKSNREW
ncbi:hypothetical protein CKA32_000080 [Geitlerinema sp. FC II]|nr:hypothetical protein CKA32_000080 [Geitlerinema sp. FC II]